MTGQPGGMVVSSGPTYRPDQMSVTWSGWPVQFSATRVRVEDSQVDGHGQHDAV